MWPACCWSRRCPRANPGHLGALRKRQVAIVRQLFGHFIGSPRHIATDCADDVHGLANLEFMRQHRTSCAASARSPWHRSRVPGHFESAPARCMTRRAGGARLSRWGHPSNASGLATTHSGWAGVVTNKATAATQFGLQTKKAPARPGLQVDRRRKCPEGTNPLDSPTIA